MTWEQVISHLTSLAQGELFCDMDNSFWDIEETLHLVTTANTPFAEPGVSGWVGLADAQDPGDARPVAGDGGLDRPLLWRQHALHSGKFVISTKKI